ncbi:MAG: hypothetical protein WAJ86_08365, partial [Candidatus Acidiferrales bacterium]
LVMGEDILFFPRAILLAQATEIKLNLVPRADGGAQGSQAFVSVTPPRAEESWGSKFFEASRFVAASPPSDSSFWEAPSQ